MAYLGQQPITGNFKKLDTISVVNGQAAYTMQYNSANYVPASANHMIVSLKWYNTKSGHFIYCIW